MLALIASLAAAAAAPPDAARSRINGCPGAMVFFDSGSADLTPQATAMLDGTWAWIGPMVEAGAWLILRGSSDSRGSVAANLDLSRRRIETVRAYYLRRGVPPDRLRGQAIGEGAPLALPRAGQPAELAHRQNRSVAVLPEMYQEVFEIFFPRGGPIC